jgi:hypothetical protein
MLFYNSEMDKVQENNFIDYNGVSNYNILY